MEALAWTCAVVGLLLGGVAAFVPGFPGCAVALLGLVAFAGVTDFAVLAPPALVLATGITVAGSVGQMVGPVVGGRAAGGTAGAATGAALGAAVGALVPLPGVSWLLAIAGAATLGFVASRGAVTGWLRGLVGTTGGCLVGTLADLLAVTALGGVLALSDFVASLP